MNDNKTEADLPTERYFTVVYKLTDANTAKYLSNRDWVSYVYADSMAELASLKELSAEPAGTVYAELPDFDAPVDPIWLAIFAWQEARSGVTSLVRAEEINDAISEQMRDFADRTHALRIASHGQAPAGVEGVKGYAMALNDVALKLRARYQSDALSTPLWAEFERTRNKFAQSIAIPSPQAAQQAPAGAAEELALTRQTNLAVVQRLQAKINALEAELDASRKAESQVQSKLDLDAAIDAARAAQREIG